jgi:hypothetical protein
MKRQGKRVRFHRWIHAGPCVVRTEVDAVIPDDDPSEPCLSPQTLVFLGEVQWLADSGDPKSWKSTAMSTPDDPRSALGRSARPRAGPAHSSRRRIPGKAARLVRTERGDVAPDAHAATLPTPACAHSSIPREVGRWRQRPDAQSASARASSRTS